MIAMNQPDDVRTTPAALEAVEAREAVEAETVAEDEFPDGTVAVPVGTATVRILPAEEWTSGAHEDLTRGQFDSWAMDCLAGDDYDKVWSELNDGRGPRLREIEAMFERWFELTGNSPGKSARSARSLRRARLR